MITVCMATYNGEKFLHTQLTSILSQLSDKDEIIISDDGSNDKTIDVIKSFKDNRITIIKNPRSWLPDSTPIISRVKYNFEKALTFANGDYIFFSDQDDEWLNNRVENAMKYFQKGGDLVVCDCIVSDEENIIFDSYFEIIKPSSSLLRTIYKSSFHGCCMAFKKEMLSSILPFPKENIGHDTWVGMIISHVGRVMFIFEPLVNYKRHSNTVTQCGFSSERSILVKFLYRISLIFAFSKRIFKICQK